MALSDMKVFDQYLYATVTEVIAQQVDKFNAASRGTITLSTRANRGDFDIEASFKEIAGLMKRRDAYGTGSINAVQLAMMQEASVKVAGGTYPVNWEPQQLAWIQMDQKVAGVVIGEQVAVGMFADMLNTGLAAARAAMVNVGATVHYTVPSQGDLSFLGLMNGARLFGDAAQQIQAWVMHSNGLFDLYGNALTNSQNLFEFGNVSVIQDGFGRVFIVTDSPSLYGAVSSPDVTDYFALGLVPGGVFIEDNADFFSNIDTTNGTENIQRTFQAEYTFNVGLKGYTWDTTNGGKSPTDAELATGTNWDKTATSLKNTAGVVVQSR